MSTFETTATVGEHGQIVIAGTPFAPGTEVLLTISRSAPADAPEGMDARRRAVMQQLFDTIKGFRQSPKFSREELYDRKCLR